MNQQASSGGVSYKQVAADYFQNRGLKRYAKVWSLWALGVGAVISGHYSGWNFGLANGRGAECSRASPRASNTS
jgi:ethanolamine permease